MRVKALEALSLYYNYGITEVAEGEEVKGGLAVHLLEIGAHVEPLDADAAAFGEAPMPSDEGPAGQSDGDGEGDPDGEFTEELDIEGTAADILDWVAGDTDRAAEALALELAKDKPRSTLVKQLEKLASSDGE
ncbi:hypothetical protein ACFV0B_11460 [Streptomyces xanthophaeus]|uniref:hypothetical protein n=1 Tax=Streptomyces xanthophaeus TaxID=67385 RepID=UPI0036B27E59